MEKAFCAEINELFISSVYAWDDEVLECLVVEPRAKREAVND